MKSASKSIVEGALEIKNLAEMQMQINARKQAFEENDIHTPTFSAPIFTAHDSVPRLANPIDPPSPTMPSNKQHNLDNKWGISFERRDHAIKDFNDDEVKEIFQLKAPSVDEHVRLAKLVVRLRTKRNRELRPTQSKRLEKCAVSTVQMASAAQPIETRLHSQLHKYHQIMTTRNKRCNYEIADSENADYEFSDSNSQI